MSGTHSTGHSSSSSDPSWRNDSSSHPSGSPGRYEWIWDSTGLARRLPSTPSATPSIPSTEEEEVSSFLRGGGRLEDYEEIRALEATTLQQEELINELQDRLHIAEWGEEEAVKMSDELADNVAGVTSAYITTAIELGNANKVICVLVLLLVVFVLGVVFARII